MCHHIAPPVLARAVVRLPCARIATPAFARDLRTPAGQVFAGPRPGLPRAGIEAARRFGEQGDVPSPPVGAEVSEAEG